MKTCCHSASSPSRVKNAPRLSGTKHLVRRGACELGLRRLRAYRKEWDESRPRHDDASHGADAFLTFACSNYTPLAALPSRKRDLGWVGLIEVTTTTACAPEPLWRSAWTGSGGLSRVKTFRKR